MLDPLLLAGDRGMIKDPRIKALHEVGFHFITAIYRHVKCPDGLLQSRKVSTNLPPIA